MSPGDVIIEHGWRLAGIVRPVLSTNEIKNFPGLSCTREVEFILVLESANPCIPSEVYACLIFASTQGDVSFTAGSSRSVPSTTTLFDH